MNVFSLGLWFQSLSRGKMRVCSDRIYKSAVSFLTLVCVCIFSPAALAQENRTIPWEEQRQVLNGAIKDYVKYGGGSEPSDIKLGTKIRVLYLGFSEEEMAKNAARFPSLPEYEFVHLPYGRKQYYDVPLNPVDYQITDTITVLNLDLASEFKNWNEGRGPATVDVSEILDPRGDFIRNIAYGLYFLTLKGARGWGNVIELGAPMDDLKSAELFYRENLLENHCSAGIDFAQDEDGLSQDNRMTVYSSAAPGSEEQIECLVLQTLIFTRPESVSFRSALKSD
ncbi:MAG: hypothetical protein AAGA50_16830 [Pseudomonadota bacterium]